MIAIVFLIIGFVFLIKGADFLVEGSSALALKLKVPQIVIGLTIVAFGTSTPELLVSVISSIRGENEIILGNVIGSNIVNLLLILGASALIYPIVVKKTTAWREIPYALILTLVVFVLANDQMIDAQNISIISRIDGLILILFFIIFIIYNFILIKTDSSSTYEITSLSSLKIAIYIVLGLAGLILGGKLVVDNAVTIAQYFSISKKIIGITIIAIGTSLPELVTSIIATMKKKSDIAIGNVVGSNIFNLSLILGVSAITRPIVYSLAFNLDMYLLIAGSFMLFIFMYSFKKHQIDRIEGVLFSIIYIAYILYLLFTT